MFGRARNHNARAKNATKSAAAKPPFTMRSLWLQVGWGLAAVAAVFVAVLSTRDELAMQRVAALLASFGLPPCKRRNSSTPKPPRASSRRPCTSLPTIAIGWQTGWRRSSGTSTT
jgi:hypothetical protein